MAFICLVLNVLIRSIDQVLSFIMAARSDLTRYWHCHKFACYISTKLAYRTGWNLNLQCRAQSASSMCCYKNIQPIYINFTKHKNKYVISARAKYRSNLSNVAYNQFSCLRQMVITFWQGVYYCIHRWLIWQHAITWTKVDQGYRRHMASLSHNGPAPQRCIITP